MMITTAYEQLLAHFGPPHNWWPIFGDDAPFEIMLGAVLVQQTRWEAVEAAILRLHNAGMLSPHALAAADPVALAALLRPVAFHTQKAPGIIAICAYLCAHYEGSLVALLAQPTATARRELLALPRIGPETADVILLYIGNHPVFVVDDYTRRLLGRIEEEARDARLETQDVKAFDWQRARYDAVQQRIERELSHSSLTTPHSSLPKIYADYHALINEECVRYCLARQPHCDGPPARRVYSMQANRESYLDRHEGCPLRSICAYYRERRTENLSES